MENNNDNLQRTESSSLDSVAKTQLGEEHKYWVTTRLGFKAVNSPKDIKSLLHNSVEVTEDNVGVDINIKTMFESRLIERLAEVELEARRKAGYSDSLESSPPSDEEWTWESKSKKYIRKKQLRAEQSRFKIKDVNSKAFESSHTIRCEGMFQDKQPPKLKMQTELPWNQSLSTSDNAINRNAKIYKGDAKYQPKETFTRCGSSSISLPNKLMKSGKKRCKHKKCKNPKERSEKLCTNDLAPKKSEDSSTLAGSDMSTSH